MSETTSWILIVGLVIISLASSGKCVTIECEFEYEDYAAIGSTYQCTVSSNPDIKSPDEILIESETGNYQNNRNVKSFLADRKTIHYFPLGLDKAFSPDIKVVKINNCGLKEIHQSDLRPFLNLIHLHLDHNAIAILEEGLFVYNTKLIYVALINNKLIHIHDDIFNHLTNLRWLRLGSNKCISVEAIDSSTTVSGIKSSLARACKSIEYLRMKKRLNELEDDIKISVINTNLVIDEIKKAKIELKSSKFSNYTRFNDQLENLWYVSINRGQELLSKGIEKLFEENRKLEQSVFNQKVMLYMSVLYSSFMIIFGLVTVKYCCTLFNR